MAIDARETAPRATDIELFKLYPKNQTKGSSLHGLLLYNSQIV